MNEKQANPHSRRMLVDIGNSVWKALRFSAAESSRSPTGLPIDPLDVDRLTFVSRRGEPTSATRETSTSDRQPADDAADKEEEVRKWVERITQHLADPLDWMVSSVSTPASQALRQAVHAIRPADRWFDVDRTWVDMPLLVEFPDRLGIDRLLAAWAAWLHCQRVGPLIVVQVGTAITVDYVSEKGAFCGGSILPGMPLALRFMAQGTDRLPTLLPPSNLHEIPFPGRNTEQAMHGGGLASVVGGIDWICRRYGQGKAEPPRMVLSGGDGAALLNLLATKGENVEHLVLKALFALSQDRPNLEDFAGYPNKS